MRIDLLQVNRMSFSAKGQGELKLRWIKYRNLASACFACLSSRSGCEGATELDIMPFFFVFFWDSQSVLEFRRGKKQHRK